MNQRTESVNHEPLTSATPEHPAEIVLDGDMDDRMRVTAWGNDADAFFRFDYFGNLDDYPDEMPTSSIDISPEAAMHLALALGGTATRLIEATK